MWGVCVGLVLGANSARIGVVQKSWTSILEGRGQVAVKSHREECRHRCRCHTMGLVLASGTLLAYGEVMEYRVQGVCSRYC
eukprot:8660072-Ditylum_brightwellii.AAC.1